MTSARRSTRRWPSPVSYAPAWTCANEALDGCEGAYPRREVLDAAMWRAARYGLDATSASPAEMVTRPASEVVGALLSYLRKGLEAHGDWCEVSGVVEEILRHGNGATRQRAAFGRRQDLGDVIAWARAVTVS